MHHTPTICAALMPAPLDPRRALELEIYVTYIDQSLAAQPELLPFNAARHLLARLIAADAAQVRQGADATTIQMLGVSARTDGSEYALLSNWRSAALARLAEGRG